MRRLLAWLGGILGGIAAWRFVRRRGEAAAGPVSAELGAEVDPRAEALRAKLDEAREAEPPQVEPGPTPTAESDDPEERRRTVHEQGRAALEEMRGDDHAGS